MKLGYLEMLQSVKCYTGCFGSKIKPHKGEIMSPSCPISTRRVDAHMVRVISFQVALVTALYLFAGETFFAFLLLFDFIVRVVRRSDFSPFHVSAKYLLGVWGVQPKLCDESPKRFALYLGSVTAFFLLLSHIVGLYTFAMLVAVILLLCALLETVFDFCIGCKLYYAIQLIKMHR
jgi:hypothetical protein